jgi:hypothetical protein
MYTLTEDYYLLVVQQYRYEIGARFLMSLPVCSWSVEGINPISPRIPNRVSTHST